MYKFYTFIFLVFLAWLHLEFQPPKAEESSFLKELKHMKTLCIDAEVCTAIQNLINKEQRKDNIYATTTRRE